MPRETGHLVFACGMVERRLNGRKAWTMKSALISTYDVRDGASIAAHRLNVGLRQLGIDSKMIVLYKNSSDDAVIQFERSESPERAFEEFLLSKVLQTGILRMLSPETRIVQIVSLHHL